mmetsp:Transcript_16800/g.46489  ORF Transcript_16800/g.46489 Transcript_16800/m.46489 type:complete len:259 (+) Transcript_16800:809-1585(+)
MEHVVPRGFHPISLLRAHLLGQGRKQPGVVGSRPNLDPRTRSREARSLGERKGKRLALVLVQGDILVVEVEHVSAAEVRVVRSEPPIGPTIGALLGAHFRALLRQPLHYDPMPIQLGSSRELRRGIDDEKAVAALREWPDIVIKADLVVQVAIVGATDQVAPPRSGGLAEDTPVSKIVVVVHDVVEVGVALTPKVCQRQHQSSSNLGDVVGFGVDGDIDVFLAGVPAHPTQVLRVVCQNQLGPERFSIDCPSAERPQR